MKRGEVCRYFYAVAIFILLINFSFAFRLPAVGGDSDNWGTVLNNFLNVSLNESGNMTSSAH
jgi:hypothetical protein